MLNRSMCKYVALTVLAVTLVVAPGQAQVESVTVAVDGLACPFCAFGLERRLKKVGGVESVRVSFKDDQARLSAGTNESIALWEIPLAIEKAGFTHGAIEISGVGLLTRGRTDGWFLTVAGTDNSFSLAGLQRDPKELRALAEKGDLVRVRGTVDKLDATHPALTLDALEAIGE